MGNQQASGNRVVKCLIYGQQSRYEIQDVVEVQHGERKTVLFKPVLRQASELELGYEWMPVDPAAFFSEGAPCTRGRKFLPMTLLQVLLRAPELYDGREEVLFAAGVVAELNHETLKSPTTLLVTSLGIVMVIRTSTKAGLGGPRLLCYFHVSRLRSVQCPSADSGELTYDDHSRPSPHDEGCCTPFIQTAEARRGGVLSVRMPSQAMAQLIAALQLVHITLGLSSQGYNLQITAVPELAQAVGQHCYWVLPSAPLDGGFASTFAANMVSQGTTVRSEPTQTLGTRYFASVPLFKLDLTDMAPNNLDAARAAAKAWRGNRQFRAFSLNRKFRAGEMQVYADAVREAPLLELDLNDARLEQEQVEALSTALGANPYRSLLALDLSGTRLYGRPAMTLASSLDEALPDPPEHSFCSLRFVDCHLDVSNFESAQLLGLIGRRCSRIEVLDLSGNTLGVSEQRGHQGLQELASFVSPLSLCGIWDSPSLRLLNLARTGVDLNAVLPSSGNGLPSKRDALHLDISGCQPIDENVAARFPIAVSGFKDLTIIANHLRCKAGIAPVRSLLAATGGPVQNRKVQLEMLSCHGTLQQTMEGAGQLFGPRDSLTIGMASTGGSTGVALRVIQAGEIALLTLLDGAPASLTLRDTLISRTEELRQALEQASRSCLASYNPKALASYGSAALNGLGVELPQPAGSGGTVSVPDPRLQQLASSSPVASVCEELRNILEANVGLESLVITVTGGSSLAGAEFNHPDAQWMIPTSTRVLPDSDAPVKLKPCAGPFLARALQGLAVNKTLLELDISFNCMGDVGAVTLGRALRKNRTLRSLSMDGNYTTVAGWTSFRGCLHGNKKLTTFAYPKADVDWFTQHLGRVISQCNQQVLTAKAAIKRAYKSSRGNKTYYVLQTQAREVEKIKAAKINMSSARRLSSKLEAMISEITRDIKRNVSLSQDAEVHEKTARPLWRDARALLRRMIKIEDKRTQVVQEEKSKMWQKQFKLWKDWCTKAAALLEKQKAGDREVDMTWFADFQKRKLQKAKGEDGVVNRIEQQCLSADEAKLLLMAVPAGLQGLLDTEIKKTRDMLKQELVKQTKVDSHTTLLESEKLSLQALIQDPAWVLPSEGSGFEDVLEGLRRFGVEARLASAPPDFITPPPQLFIPSAPPPEAAAPVSTTEGMVSLPMPTAPPLENTSVTPAQAAVQYNMYQLHSERVAQQERTSGHGGMSQFQQWLQRWRQKRQRQRDEAAARRAERSREEDARFRGGYGYGSYGYNSYWYNDPFYDPYGFGYYGYGPWYSYDPYDPFFDRGWDPWSHHHHWDPFFGDVIDADVPYPIPFDGDVVDADISIVLPADVVDADISIVLPADDAEITVRTDDVDVQGDRPDDVTPGDDKEDDGDGHGDGDGGGDGGGEGDDGSPDGHDADGDAPDDGPDDPDGPGDDEAPDPTDDAGDADAHMYGGGEEPPLPDGGSDEPHPAPPVCVPMPGNYPAYCWRNKRAKVQVHHSDAEVASMSLHHAELEAMQEWFGTLHKDLPYAKERDVLQTREEALEVGMHGVCLVTQCSVDRLERLRSLCLAWAPGFCSCAVFLKDDERRQEVVSSLREIHAACVEQGGSLVASIVCALPASMAATPYDCLYPVNALRNVAMEEACSDVVFVLDVDFVPSRDLHAALCLHPGGIKQFLSEKDTSPAALVVPAFEVHLDPSGKLHVPRSFSELCEEGRHVDAFHMDHFPKGHQATDFTRWATLASEGAQNCWSFQVAYEEFFEPYVVLNRKVAPRFDERFRGYGLNKCSFLRHCHALGFRFEVLVQGAHFVAAAEHERSAAWHHTYGPGADPAEALKLGLLWRLFLRELPENRLAQVSQPAVTCSTKSVQPTGTATRAMALKWPCRSLTAGKGPQVSSLHCSIVTPS